MRNMRRRGPALAIAGLLCGALAGSLCGASPAADVLTVEHPGKLVVFNKYQQRLGPGEERLLPPYVPMILVRENDVLGDGFTPCATVEIARERFYLLRDADGGFSRKGDPGEIAIFRNVTLFGDTIVVLRGRALKLQQAGTNGGIPLQAGARVLRVFERGPGMYVRSPSGRFGWITSPRSAGEWREAVSPSPAAQSPAELEQRVQPVVDAANRSLRRIYAAVAGGSGTARTPPSFRLAGSRGEVLCVLDPASRAGSFIGSMRALLPEFERVLGGTGLHAEMSGDAIRIPLR